MNASISPFLEFVYSERQISYERHFHNAFELLYILEGSARFDIGNTCYHAQPHTMLFIGKHEEHSMRITGGHYRRMYIVITPPQLESLIDDTKLKSIFLSRPESFNHTIDMSLRASQAQALLEAMRREHEHPGPYCSLVLASYFRLLMALCYRTSADRFALPAKKTGRLIFEIQRYIDANFDRDIRMEELSARFFISPSHLSHIFRGWIGSSPKQYIMSCRIARAKELLLETDLPVTQIAARAGFGDASNFIRSFKKESGETPFKYRSQTRSM